MLSYGGLVSRIEGLDKGYISRGGVEGRSIFEVSDDRARFFRSAGRLGMQLDAVEAARDVEKRGVGPTGDLVRLQASEGDPGGMAAIVAHDVLDGVGVQEGKIEGSREVELVQGDEFVTGLLEPHGGPERRGRVAEEA